MVGACREELRMEMSFEGGILCGGRFCLCCVGSDLVVFAGCGGICRSFVVVALEWRELDFG
jgi:hypothetical protein